MDRIITVILISIILISPRIGIERAQTAAASVAVGSDEAAALWRHREL